MTSWYSQLLTTTSSRFTDLQRTFLASDADGETEDDTHICRVLRSYYTEKGRPFPGWLPPDPKAPSPVQPVYVQQSNVGNRYGGLASANHNENNNAAGGGGGGGSGGAGKLNSLWDNGPTNQRQDQFSLRQGRGAPPPMRGAEQPAAASRNPFMSRGNDPRDDAQARPLPSQRAGSYQQYGRNSGDDNGGPQGGGSSAGGSAQDRLRQRLWGGGAGAGAGTGAGGSRTASPTGAGPYQPPQRPPSSNNGGSGRYGGGGPGDYEERFAPGGMYDGTGGGGRPMGGSSQYGRAGGGGGSASQGTPQGRIGLPSGPRRGLPSGPRMR